MLRIVNIAMGLDDTEKELRVQIAKALHIRPQEIKGIRLIRKAVILPGGPKRSGQERMPLRWQPS